MNLVFLKALVSELEATLDIASSFASEKMYIHGICTREELDYVEKLEGELEKARTLLAKAVAENAVACNYEREENFLLGYSHRI